MATLTWLVLSPRSRVQRGRADRDASSEARLRVLIFEERPGNWAIVAPFPERPRGSETDAVTLARHFYPRSEIIVRRMSGEEARYAVTP